MGKELQLEDFDAVCTALITHQTLKSPNSDAIITTSLTQLIEFVVYGDVKDETFFHLFCERRILHVFMTLLRKNKSFHVHILRTVQICIQSVTSETSLYFLLSNNLINEIISFPYHFHSHDNSDNHNISEEDEDLLPLFLSLLKTISLLFAQNSKLIQFFIDERTHSIPLLIRAIELLSSQEDSMIRVGAQVVILNVFKVEESSSREIITSDVVLFDLTNFIVRYLESTHRTILKTFNQIHKYRSKGESSKCSSLLLDFQESVHTFEDWILFISDLFSLQIPSVTSYILQSIVSDYLYLSILEPLHKNAHNVVIAQFSCTTLCLLLQMIPSTDFLTALLMAGFHPLSRRERKKILFQFFSKEYPSSSSSDSTSALIEPNPYRISLTKFSENPLHQERNLRSCFVLYWLSARLADSVKALVSPLNESVVMTAESIHQSLQLLYLYTSLHILPTSPSFLSPLSYLSPSCHCKSISSDKAASDPDLLGFKASEELEYLAKATLQFISQNNIPSLLDGVQSLLLPPSSDASLLSIQTSIITIYHFLTALLTYKKSLLFFQCQTRDTNYAASLSFSDFYVTILTNILHDFLTRTTLYLQSFTGIYEQEEVKEPDISFLLLLVDEYFGLRAEQDEGDMVSSRFASEVALIRLRSVWWENSEVVAAEEDMHVLRKTVKIFFFLHLTLRMLSREYPDEPLLMFGIADIFTIFSSTCNSFRTDFAMGPSLDDMSLLVTLLPPDDASDPLEPQQLRLVITAERVILMAARHPSNSTPVLFAVSLLQIEASLPHIKATGGLLITIFPVGAFSNSAEIMQHRKFPYLTKVSTVNAPSEVFQLCCVFDSSIVRDAILVCIQKQKSELVRSILRSVLIADKGIINSSLALSISVSKRSSESDNIVSICLNGRANAQDDTEAVFNICQAILQEIVARVTILEEINPV